MYVDVLTQIGVKAIDKTFVYNVPSNLRSSIKIGIRVKVPFGKLVLEGFVMKISADTDYDNSKIKNIISITDSEPVLNKEMLLLGKYMSDNLLCSLVSSYQVMLPKALKAEVNSNIKIKYDEVCKIISENHLFRLTPLPASKAQQMKSRRFAQTASKKQDLHLTVH